MIEELISKLYDRLVTNKPESFFDIGNVEFYHSGKNYILIRQNNINVKFISGSYEIVTNLPYATFSIELFLENLLDYISNPEGDFFIIDNLFIPDNKMEDLMRDNNKMVEELQEQKDKILNLEMIQDSDKNKIDKLYEKIHTLDSIVDKFISRLLDAI